MKGRILCNLNSIIITLIFSIAIFVPFSIGIVEKDKDVSVIEKRELSTFPQIGGNINDIKKFPKLFDTYYSDHFGLRDWFTKYYKLVKFNLGDSPSNDVSIGKDGWLFLGSIKKGYNKYSDPIGDVRNINLFSKSDLNKFATYMVSLNTWLNEKGIEYLLVIAPNKHTIYFDKLPGYISKVNEYSATDQLVEYLKFHTDVPVVDLRKTLIKQKKKHQLYYKTGTHWNFYGGNIVQYEIMQEIEKMFPGKINPELYDQSTFEYKTATDRGLEGMAGIYASPATLAPYPKFGKHGETIDDYPKGSNNEDLGRRIHTNINPTQKLNVIIFRDSFFRVLEPYFYRKFKRSTYVWERLKYSSLEKYVNSENPDIIIEEWVERSLPFVPKIPPDFIREFNKTLFESSDKSIFLNNFSRLTYNSHIKRMVSANKSIRMKSMGADPIIFFPPLLLERSIQYIVHLEIKSSVNSRLQLFYSDSEVAGNPFSEKNSSTVGINSGENDIYILLDYDKLGKRLRLDPISGIGEVEIKTVEIREIKNQP